VLLCLLAVLAGADTFVEIARVRAEEDRIAAAASTLYRWNAVAQPGDIFATLKPRSIAAMLRRLGVTSAQLDELHVGKPGRIG
jgi:hypothetical protein